MFVYANTDPGAGSAGDTGLVKSAIRVIEVLELLAAHPEGFSHARLSDELGIPKSSLTQLIGNLLEAGYVELSEDGRRYLLGAKVVGLARSYLSRIDIVRIAQPVVARVSERLGDSCALTVPAGAEMLVVCKQDSVLPLQHSMQLGDRGPIYASASGKAVLAARGPDAIETFLAGVAPEPLTPYTLTDIAALRADLARARMEGVGYSRRELIDGIFAIAVPVFDAAGQPVAGLSVSVPEPRHGERHARDVVAVLREHSAALSEKLGAQGARQPGQQRA